MLDIKKLLDEALTIPANSAGPVELKLRDALEKRKDCKYEDVIIKCCRNDEKGGKIDAKELIRTYVLGLGNIIDLLKVYDKCKNEYIQQKIDKKVKIERADGKTVELDPLKDLNKISRLPALKQFIENFEKLVDNDTSVKTTFKKYAINDYDRVCIRLLCWNSRVMVWGTKKFEPSQKFAVQLWQNIETIDSGSAYGDPDKQCPYCTHSKNHWDNHSEDDPDYEQYWYLKIPNGISCTKKGNLNIPEVVKVYNQLKGLGPEILVCQHDSNDDWCDRDDNPISEYEVDIHDADETIYLNDDGEVIDPDDIEDEDNEEYEELDFNFGPGSEDFYKDVVELYDKWFTDHENDISIPKQPWETDGQYNDRKNQVAKFVKYVGDTQTEEKNNREFDFEHDVWTHPIILKAEHFKDGILAVQLPQVMSDWLKIEGAEIASFAGFPRDIIGNGALKGLRFESCKLKSAKSWSPSEDTKNGLRLTFSNCAFEDSFKLGDSLGGASLAKLVINGTIGENTKTIKDFKFLGGMNKLKRITNLSIETAKVIESFEGLSESLEDQKIQTIFINNYQYGDNIQINHFKGLPPEVENFIITRLKTTEEAVKNLDLIFPIVSTKLEINIRNTEQEILVPMFRTIWTKAQDNCEFEYIESGKHVFDTLNIQPVLKVLKDDKVPSRFSGLQRKKFVSQKINLDLSPRNMYEEKSFLSSDVGFGDSGVFDPQKIPLFQNERKIFNISYGSYYLNERSYATVKDGRIVCFSPSMDIIEGPFTKETIKGRSWDTICLDASEHGPDFNLDEALKVFLATRKTDFPEVKTLVLNDGFTGKTISNIDDPGLSLRLSRNGCPNLVEVSRCKLAALQDERGETIHWDDKKTFESLTIYKDCVFSDGSKLDAKAVYNCTIGQPEKDKEWVSRHGGVAAIQISAKEGVFNSKLLCKSLGIVVKSPVVESCDIESGGNSVEILDIRKLASTKLVAKNRVKLRITEDSTIARDCWLESTGGEEVEVSTYAGKTKIDPAKSDEIASAIASCLKGQQLKNLNMYQLSITSLKFLEELPAALKVQQVELNVDELKDFSFKLKSPGQVGSLGYPYYARIHVNNISKDATLDGFDGSVSLSLGYRPYRKSDDWTSKVAEQFDKYFTQSPKGPYHIYQAKSVDPNYIDKDGRFAAPKTLDERLFGRPTTTEEDNWLRVMRLFS